LFLSLLSTCKLSVSELKKTYPEYFMGKGKIQLEPTMDVDALLLAIEKKYASNKPSTIDGVKIDFEASWVHLRKSNTEPIIRVYTEAPSQEDADLLMNRFKEELLALGN